MNNLKIGPSFTALVVDKQLIQPGKKRQSDLVCNDLRHT
jgi:hypothetical protein